VYVREVTSKLSAATILRRNSENYLVLLIASNIVICVFSCA